MGRGSLTASHAPASGAAAGCMPTAMAAAGALPQVPPPGTTAATAPHAPKTRWAAVPVHRTHHIATY